MLRLGRLKGDSWGYTSVGAPQDLEDLYGQFSASLKNLRDRKGLSAAVYTQIFDVEIEVNGPLPYDRRLKPRAVPIALANRFAYPAPFCREVLPTSEKAA